MIKRILVVLDASPRAALRLRMARTLIAHELEGDVTAFYGVLPTLLGTPWATGEGIAGAASLMAELDADQRRRARTMVAEAGDAERLRWLDGGDSPYRTLLQQSFTHDLLILGQHDPADMQTGVLPADLVPAVILGSGRPTLALPAAGAFESTSGPVLVAWKPTREAARAVTVALPWLQQAPEVHIAARQEDEAAEPSLPELEHWLQLQGIRGNVQRHLLPHGEVGERLLSLATDLGAALLVMGCYGHSRAREWALGGVTRTVLRAMTLPVLMVH